MLHACWVCGRFRCPVRVGKYRFQGLCLGMAVEQDAQYKKLALDDPDLEPLWDSLAVAWP